MAIKKKAKRKFAARRTVTAPKPVSNENFFQRMKEIIKSEMPQPEKVRVKTFIVEKPVIIHDKASKYDSDDSTYDSKRSRYSRNSIATGMGLIKQKKKPVEEEEFDQSVDEEPFTDDSSANDETGSSADEFGEEGTSEDAELVDEGAQVGTGEDFGEEAPLEKVSPTHTRSRGLFNNIWWKKALFWAILVWLFILAISMAMQAMKLIVVDLTRQWWMLLGIIVIIEMIYFKFFDGKLNI
jgi:hypothetical protein